MNDGFERTHFREVGWLLLSWSSIGLITKTYTETLLMHQVHHGNIEVDDKEFHLFSLTSKLKPGSGKL